MVELSPESKRLLALARAEEPSEVVRDRLRAAIDVKVAAGEPPPQLAQGAKAGASLKIVASSIAVILAAGSIVILSSRREPEAREPLAMVEAVEPAPVVTASTSTVAPPRPTEAPPPEPKKKRKRVVERSLPPPPPDTLKVEVELLERARRALDRNQPALALGIGEEHRRRFPRGVLADESAALRVLALCKLGREDDALRVARELAASSPKSLAVEKLRSSCARGVIDRNDGGTR